jgi:hypothetical protein
MGVDVGSTLMAMHHHLEQLLATQNDLMTLLIQNETSWGRTGTTLSTPGYEHVLLRVPVNSPATILWGEGPNRGR